MEVQYNPTDQAFTVRLDGAEGELTYAQPSPQVVDFQHTWVDEALRGRGVADALAEAGLNWAKSAGYKVLLTCKFMQGYVKRHPEWEALRA